MTTPTTDHIDTTIATVLGKVREGLTTLEGAAAFAEAAMRIVEEALQAFKPQRAHLTAPVIETEFDPGASPSTLRP